ncbi:MAG: hypothetical protein M3158_05215 [Pseudomonadota bacterium]|nr:hypothetical protein [Pseudomonadota bacterium]
MTPARPVQQRLLSLPLWPLIAGYLLLSDVIAPALQPVIRALARLRPVQRLRTWLESLGPYTALVILGVPAAVIEVLKLGAVFWVARGHVVSGTAALLALHGASLLSTERLFTVVKPQLLTIPWFAALWGRVEAVRDALLRWLHGTRAWGQLRILLGHLRRAFTGAAEWVQAEFKRIAGRLR